MVDQVLKVVVKRGWEKDSRDGGCGQFLRTWALRTCDHGGYGHTITCKIAKCFEPSGTEGAEGLFLKNRHQRLPIFYAVATALSIFLIVFKFYAALAPTLIVAGFMLLAGQSSPQSPSRFRRYLAARPLSYWVMTWFLFELFVLTAIGTFFRGPGWEWVWPWQGS